MNQSTVYTTALTPIIPFLSALACGILVALSLQDCLKQDERKLKRIVLLYLILSGMGWFVTFAYEFVPVLFVCLHVVCLVTYILPSLFFYRIIRYLTRLGQAEEFPRWHYLLPGVLTAAMLIWSLFVPFGVQLEIVTGKAEVLPAGYEAYARFFITKPLWRVVFGLVYYFLALWVLLKYYHKAAGNKTRVRKPARWVLFLVGLSLASLFSSVLPTFMPRSEILYSVWTLLVASGIATQHILLSYHIMRRDYYPYVIPQKRFHTSARRHEVKYFTRRKYTGKLNRSIFEKFIFSQKPYLNPDYKITDLIEDLDVNRTAISSFINQTYHMNFNRYLNCLRLKELDKLRSQPGNEKKSLTSLTRKVGFKGYRNYLRAVAAEREVAAPNGNAPEVNTPEEEGGEE